MKKSIKTMIVLCVTAWTVFLPGLSAQTYSFDPQHAFLQEENIWLRSNNPAAIGVLTLPDLGSVRFTGEHQSGNLHRTMDTETLYGWGFGADNYKSLKHLNLWGDFTFRNNRHKNRQWSDNFHPYNGNPYQVGSDLKGNYIEQTFDFGVRISSKRLFNRLWLALGFDYSLGDLSRINDPRSRVQFADMTIIPGIVVELARHHQLGLHFNYRYRKERNNRYVTQSSDANEFLVYSHEGMGIYSQVMANQFERRTKGHYFGGGLQYVYRRDNLSLLTGIDYDRHTDHMEDYQLTSPGDWTSQTLAFGWTMRWKNASAAQTVSLQCAADQGSAQKYFQELRHEQIPGSETEKTWYETILKVRSYTQDKIKTGLTYEYRRKNGQDYLWHVRPSINWQYQHDRYVYYKPASDLESSGIDLEINGGLRLLYKQRHRLYASLTAGYHLHLSGNLFCSTQTDNRLIWDNITAPDFIYLRSDVAHIGLDLRYIFPISKKINGFVQLEGTELISTSLAGQHRHFADIAVGILHRF